MTRTVLFLCNLNSVRSPMAAALLRALAPALRRDLRVDSAGLYDGGFFDPMVEKALDEIGVAFHDHAPKSMGAIDLSAFDLVVALTPEAAAEARRVRSAGVEFWPIDNPSDAQTGTPLDAYRAVRDDLRLKLAARFSPANEKP